MGRLLGPRQPLDERQRPAILAGGDRHSARLERQPPRLPARAHVDGDELANLGFGGILRLVAGAQEREPPAVGAPVQALGRDTGAELHATHHREGRRVDDRRDRLAGRLVAALALVLARPPVEHHEARAVRALKHRHRGARQRQRAEPLSGRQLQRHERARPRVEHVGPRGGRLCETGAGRPQARQSQGETDPRGPESHQSPQWNVMPISNVTTSWLQPPRTVSPSKSRSPGLP